jgi:hypothetical protein
MTNVIVNGNLESAFRITFEETFYKLASQKQSYLENIALKKPFSGAAYGISRMGNVELEKEEGRNPLRNPQQPDFDRRWQTKENWSRDFALDKYDIQDMIADPTSVLYTSLIEARNRLIDRVLIRAAIAEVRVGASFDNSNVITAEEDGVKTIDATSGYNYDKVKEVNTKFKNSYHSDARYMIQTPNEESELLDDEKFINRDYRNQSNTAVETGSLSQSLGINFISNFAGSDNGGAGGNGKILNPIIPEIGGTRLCVAMVKDAVQLYAMEMDINYIPASSNPIYKHTNILSLALRVSSLRLEGSKVIIVKTTI